MNQRFPYMVMTLLDRGADIEARNKFGDTPLHLAALNSNSTAVVYLLHKGANINIRNKANLTPLHVAATKDSPEVVKELLNAGADINKWDEKGVTPLDLAIVKFLFNAGCKDIFGTAELNNPLSVLTDILDTGHNITEIRGCESGTTPLHLAAESSISPTIVKLILKGPDYDYVPGVGLVDPDEPDVAIEEPREFLYPGGDYVAAYLADKGNEFCE